MHLGSVVFKMTGFSGIGSYQSPSQSHGGGGCEAEADAVGGGQTDVVAHGLGGGGRPEPVLRGKS